MCLLCKTSSSVDALAIAFACLGPTLLAELLKYPGQRYIFIVYQVLSAFMALLYFENTMGRIYEHPAGFALLRYRAGRRSLSDVQAFLVHTGRLLQQRGWRKMLSDQRLLTPFTEVEQALILDYWQAHTSPWGPR